ncbi:MAG: hypothetical protein JNL82_22545 [Myxococcales bacterium]|nr:hypothetical protein [Myxococcales bacterium]
MDEPVDRRETFRRMPSSGPAWDEAVEAGIDMGALLRNLQLTPAERVAQHEEGLEFIRALHGAMTRAAVQR